MSSSLNRRDFLKFTGLGAAGAGAWPLVPAQGRATAGQPAFSGYSRIGAALRVKPVLVYEISKREKATSWRPWGGLQSEDDAVKEIARIGRELQNLRSQAEFQLEFLPVARVSSQEQADQEKSGEFDVLLIYAASGRNGWLETLASSEKQKLMFIRHKSGPVYLWYEIAHPRLLRKTTDQYQEKNLDVWDIVVDDYSEVLWRLRSLFGLKNIQGTRIVCIGKAGGWGEGGKYGPDNAKNIWKMDLREVPYEELEPLLKKALGDKKTLQQAGARAGEYLSQEGVTLQTDKQFVVNAFVLYQVFKDLMDREGAPALTVLHCMNTIMPLAQTTACLPLSLINDEGLMAFCESDFAVIPSGVLLRYISGKPSFLQDPTHPHDGVVTVAHCTAPRRMNGQDCEPAIIMTHFESDYGATPKVEMRKGQMVTNLCPSFKSDKWIGFRGRIIDHPFYDICRSQIDVEIEGDWRKLLEDMQGFHWMTCYGDYLREVGYALRKVGIAWENLTTGQTI